MYEFTYDAWNRMVKVTKAYRDSGGTIQTGSVVNEIEYDGLGRRIVKAVKNSADLDCTYHYYYDGHQCIETRNGSDQVIKQHVWGALYIDEVVEIGLNDDPTEDDDADTFYHPLHDSSFNILALVDAEGILVERYEYDPYGRRTVFISPGVNDPDAHAPTHNSTRWEVSTVEQPWGLCEFGFQGLMHDESTALIHNRARTWLPVAGRFAQRDPLGYVDGASLYAGYHVMHGGVDPDGLGFFDWWYENTHYLIHGETPAQARRRDQQRQAQRASMGAASRNERLRDAMTATGHATPADLEGVNMAIRTEQAICRTIGATAEAGIAAGRAAKEEAVMSAATGGPVTGALTRTVRGGARIVKAADNVAPYVDEVADAAADTLRRSQEITKRADLERQSDALRSASPKTCDPCEAAKQAQRMRENAAQGRLGEAAAGIDKNTTRIPSASGKAKYRVPDGRKRVGSLFS